MLYMVIVTHSEDNCPLVSKSVRNTGLASARREEIAKTLGITSKGSWTNLLSHTTYTVVDAPNAHAISQWLLENKILDWNKAVVEPVITREEVAALIQKANAA
jgi:hypothetical protein